MSGSGSTGTLPGRRKSMEREEGNIPGSSGGAGMGEQRPTSTSSLAAVRHMARKQSDGQDPMLDPMLSKMSAVPRKASKDKAKGVSGGDGFLLTPITYPRSLDSDDSSGDDSGGDHSFSKVTKGKALKDRRVSGVDVGVVVGPGDVPTSDSFPEVKKGPEMWSGHSPTDPATPRKVGVPRDASHGSDRAAVAAVSPVVAPPAHVTTMSSSASLSTTKVWAALCPW